MSDWEFLYEMNERGYSAEDIADAAACGVAPWEGKYIPESVSPRVKGLTLRVRAIGGSLVNVR
ncbi:MAG: hypothetical protein EON54_24605 [Alcaligenaceae bacterium]|nr:MAG: hypothetical protein EON54_24605 [Alcaligenaceae bacterium]